MAIPVKLEVFEGPLDLLLHLIDKNKIDIYDIPIVTITEQYLEYVRAMVNAEEERESTAHEMEVTSEFMVMAATLLDIKCRMLLPPEEPEDEDGPEDPRAELVERLIEYKKYKFMALVLRDQMEETGVVIEREQNIPESVLAYRPPVDLDELLEGVTMDRLYAVFQDILKREKDKIDPIRSRFGKVEKDKISLADQMLDLERKVIKKRRMSFREFLKDQPGRTRKVVSFLAILELIHFGKIRVTQDGIFGDITIESLEDENTVPELFELPAEEAI